MVSLTFVDYAGEVVLRNWQKCLDSALLRLNVHTVQKVHDKFGVAEDSTCQLDSGQLEISNFHSVTPFADSNQATPTLILTFLNNCSQKSFISFLVKSHICSLVKNPLFYFIHSRAIPMAPTVQNGANAGDKRPQRPQEKK